MKKLRLKAIIVVGLVFTCLLLMLACAPHAAPPDDEVNDNGSTVVVAGGGFTWSESSDCALCHPRSISSLAALSCEAAQGDPNSTCMECHANASGVASAHASVTLADTSGDQSRLKNTKIDRDTCLSCHNLEDLIVATADNTTLTDAEGTTVNPHETMTVINVDGTHDNTTCASCHKMHSDEPLADIAIYWCLSCHHEGVYECYTCHG